MISSTPNAAPSSNSGRPIAELAPEAFPHLLEADVLHQVQGALVVELLQDVEQGTSLPKLQLRALELFEERSVIQHGTLPWAFTRTVAQGVGPARKRKRPGRQPQGLE